MGEGRPHDAVNLVESAAHEGTEEALLALAEWRLFGVLGKRDVALAHRLLERASAAGSIEARRIRACLIANGTGTAPDPEAAAALLAEVAERDPASKLQLDLLAAMAAPEEAVDLPSETICANPSIRLIRGLLSQAECQHICSAANPYLQPSFVIDPRSGRAVPNPIRSSFGTNFGPTQEDLVINAVVRRIAAATGTSANCGEPLHVLRYTPGQQYRPHHDALANAANQREWTVLLYLNSEYEGGETHFPEADVAIKGRTGDALVFRNIDDCHRPNPRARHAGLPPRSGSKWLATRWIRQSAFDPWNEQT